MVELIPAIIPNSLEDIKQKIKLLEPFIFRQDSEEPPIRTVQIDIGDGKFTGNVTWNDPDELSGFSLPVKAEVHLMVADSLGEAKRWVRSGVTKIITHIETTPDPAVVSKLCHDAGIEYGLALKSETSSEKIIPWINDIDSILFLSESFPGLGGQKFIPATLDKIKALRARYLNVKIEVDGGVKVGIARQVKEAGADMIIAGSAIFQAPNISNALLALARDIK